MAKRKKSAKRRVASGPVKRPAAPAARATEPPKPEVDLAEEYRYVVTDLKRIGILAAAMFALLVVLALVLQNI